MTDQPVDLLAVLHASVMFAAAPDFTCFATRKDQP